MKIELLPSLLLVAISVTSYILISDAETNDCTWNEWGTWEMCSATCGNGTQERNRTKIPANHDGADCNGNYTENQTCNAGPCPGIVLTFLLMQHLS